MAVRIPVHHCATHLSLSGREVKDPVVLSLGPPPDHHPAVGALSPHHVQLHQVVAAGQLLLVSLQRVLGEDGTLAAST